MMPPPPSRGCHAATIEDKIFALLLTLIIFRDGAWLCFSPPCIVVASRHFRCLHLFLLTASRYSVFDDDGWWFLFVETFYDLATVWTCTSKQISFQISGDTAGFRVLLPCFQPPSILAAFLFGLRLYDFSRPPASLQRISCYFRDRRYALLISRFVYASRRAEAFDIIRMSRWFGDIFTYTISSEE